MINVKIKYLLIPERRNNMFKKSCALIMGFLLVFLLAACGSETVDYSGTHIGYAWKGESKGTPFEDASEKIETILTLDEEGVIVDVKTLFWKKSGDYWYTRQDGTARVSVDLTKSPTAATLGDDYAEGTSMFSIDTHDKMSFYAVKVDEYGIIALVLVEPITRYQFEMKMQTGYDFRTKVKDVTIDGTEGGFVPTVKASGKGLIRLKSLTELEDKNIFNVHEYFNVMSKRGVLKDINSGSTVQELLEAIGVTFIDNIPQETGIISGFHSNGGWAGNYEAIEKFLIGKNEEYFFGVDNVAGATKTVQNSTDTIAGATVRMSRESTSYQRALVDAGILEESEVVKGRFE
jgi:hypothetical protein